MNSRHSWLSKMLSLAIILILLVPASLPTADAQDNADTPTDTTDTTEQSRDRAAPQPPTPMPTQVPPTSESSPEPLPTVGAVETVVDSIATDFEDFTGEQWQLAGWQLASTDDNQYLSANSPGATARIVPFVHANFELTTLLRVASGDTATIAFDSDTLSYQATFDSTGNIRLYENGTAVAAARAQDTTDGQLSGATWSQMTVRLVDGTINISQGGTLQLAYTTSAPVSPGRLTFSAGSNNAGEVALDNISATALTADAAISTPVPAADDASNEQSSGTAETNQQATTSDPAIVLRADFENGTPGWNLTGSAGILPNMSNNSILQMFPGSAFSPANAIELDAYSLRFLTQIQGTEGESALILTIGNTTVAFNPSGLQLLQDGDVVARHEGAYSLDTWYRFDLDIRSDGINVRVDNQPVFDEAITIDGAITFNAQSRIALDNVVIRDNTNSGAPVSQPPAAPDRDRDRADDTSRLQNGLGTAMQAYASGNEQDALVQFGNRGFEIDDAQRILIGIRPADSNVTTEDLAATVRELGGEVVAVNDIELEAWVSLDALQQLSRDERISGIRRPARASSTGPVNSPAAAPGGSESTEAFDQLGVQDWHANGYLGDGTRVGVIDLGFEGFTVGTGEQSCLTEVPIVGNGSHGLNVVRVLCDLAPNASVYGFAANNYTSLFSAVNTARTYNLDVLVITLDLGANSTPGDGSGISGTSDPYAELAAARSEGTIIFAAAGNGGTPNNPAADPTNGRLNRYQTVLLDPVILDSTDPEEVTPREQAIVTMTASPGDRVNVSWNDWNGRIGSSANNKVEDFQLILETTNGDLLDDYQPPLFARTSAAVPPTVQLTVSNGIGNCTLTNGTCQVQLRIARVQGDLPAETNETTVMQVQLTPNIFVNSSDATIRESNQPNGVYISGVTTVENADTPQSNTGSLARPADSPDVIAVGAVCAGQGTNLATSPTTSVGPIFDEFGDLPTGTTGTNQANTKPDITSLTHVTTFLDTLEEQVIANAAACGPTYSDLDAAGGFGGTSAAAAHAAGMAAVILSNTSINADFNTGDATGVQNLFDYMQSRSVDLPLTGPNGFDTTFGVGFSALGSPTYDPINDQNITQVPDLIPTECLSTRYVGIANPSATSFGGNQTNPYLHINRAVDESSAGDCVVVMPGEYITPLYFDANTPDVGIYSYNSVTGLDYAPSLIRSGMEYTSTDSAGIYFENTTGQTLGGFGIYPTAKYNTALSNGIVLDSTSGMTLTNNIIGEDPIAADGIDFTGWLELGASPVQVLNSDGTTITENRFLRNTVGWDSANSRYDALISVSGSGGTTPVQIIDNDFRNNTATESESGGNLWGSLLYAGNSNVDLVGNAFVGNTAGTMITAATATDTNTETTNIVSNVLLENTTSAISSGTGVTAGPLVHALYTPELAFNNNTVVNNDFSASSTVTSSVLLRGDRTGTTGSTGATPSFDFFNNLVYNGTTVADLTPYADTVNTITSCDNLNGDGTTGLRNWWYNGAAGLPTVCGFDINTNLNTNPDGQFVGQAASTTLDPATNINYWGLFFDDETSTFSDGQDYGLSNTSVVAPYSTSISTGYSNPPFDRDVNGQSRLFGIANWEDGNTTDNGNYVVDTGAFEASSLQIVNDVEYDVSFPEDADNIVIDLNQAVSGGFGQLAFTLTEQLPDTLIAKQLPDNYGRQCGEDFTNGLKQLSNSSRVQYCAPANFYTDTDLTGGSGTLIENPDYLPPSERTSESGENTYYENTYEYTDDDPFPDYVIFTYTVTDEAGVSESGVVRIRITPETDAPLTEVIGDGVPPSDEYVVTASRGQTVTVPLRPFVDFNNFYFSESNNPSFFTPTSVQADYPFTVGNLSVADPQNLIVNNTTIDNGTSTSLELTVSETETGQATITYDVTDANGSTTTGNTIVVRVISRVPSEPGIYDDSSFAFSYTDGDGTYAGWKATSDGDAINNTLHTAGGQNDTAQFGFEGTGFVLYLQQAFNSGFFNLDIDGTVDNDSTWTQISGSPAVYEGTIGSFTCTTQAVQPDLSRVGNPLTLNARGRGSAAITCNGGLDDTHIVKVINRDVRRALNIDAFSIVDDDANNTTTPLTPGFHEVDNATLRTALDTAGLTESVNLRYSNRLAYVATPATGNPTITFDIEGGTGFALGTMLNRYTADYTVCVGDGTNETCQNYTNSPESNLTRIAPDTFRPFYGLNPDQVYTVSITINSYDTGSFVTPEFVFDSLVVFPPSEQPTLPMDTAVYDDADVEYFVYGNGLEDSWSLNAISRRAKNNTLTEIQRRVTTAGPYISFDLRQDTNNINSFYWTYESRRPSDQVMICVDRGVDTLTASDTGNCLQVNLQNGDYTTADGAKSGNLQVSDGALLVRESDFSRAWETGTAIDRDYDRDGIPDAQVNTIEIFSLTDNPLGFSMDELIVLDDSAPLPTGKYEEYVRNIEYLDASGTPSTWETDIVTTNNTFQTPFGPEWNQLYGLRARRDSGSGVMYTTNIGSIIRFEFEGTGFAPLFRTQRQSDAVKVCHIVGSETALTTLANGTCQTFDNESLRSAFSVKRPVLGLASNTYTVAIQMLDDNFSPDYNRFRPIEMWFDGVIVYDDDFTTLTPLTTGDTAEVNYDNRDRNDQFAFVGGDWTTFEGLRARRYSGNEYNIIRRPDGGETVAFKVSQANVLTLNRDLRRTYSPWLVCATDTGTGDRYCQTVSNDGRGFGNEISMSLTPDRTVGDYIVTMTVLDASTITLDAITPRNIGTGDALTRGTYPDNHPAIAYESGGENRIANGSFEANNSDAPDGAYWSNVGSPTESASNLASSYDGRFGWRVTTGGANVGIQSESFDLEANQRYTILARVRVNATTGGQVTMALNNTGVNNSLTTDDTALGNFQTLRFEAQPTGNETGNLTFLSSQAMTFDVDDVQVIEGSGWQANFSPRSDGGFTTVSTTNGAAFEVNFTGTGITFDMAASRFNGNVEICYGLQGGFPGNQTCATFDNESIRNTDAKWTISGLPQGTYTARVEDAEDGQSVVGFNAPSSRNSRLSLGVIELDQITVFDDPPPPTVATGSYDDATISGSDRLLQLQPQSIWTTVEGRRAFRYRNETYTTRIDPANGRQERAAIGGTASLNLNIPANDTATVIIDGYRGVRLNTDALMACVDAIEGAVTFTAADGYTVVDTNGTTNCHIYDELTSSGTLTLSPDTLPLLENTTGSAVARTLSLQAVSSGRLEIDNYQVLYGSVLLPGYYEETIGRDVLQTTSGTWTTLNNPRYSGDAGLQTNSPSAQLTYNFSGTGTSIVTELNQFTGGRIDVTISDSGGTVLTDTIDSDAPDSNITSARYQSALSYAGLPNGDYEVTLDITNDDGESVSIDAVEVYGAVQQLGSLYDDAGTDANDDPYITYGPDNDSWIPFTGFRARTALNETVHQAQNYGAIASFEIGATNAADGILLYYDRPAPNPLEVCFYPVGGAYDPSTACQDVPTPSGEDRVRVDAGADGNYIVTIENKSFASGFQLDAIQVLDGTFVEGIYTAEDINADASANSGTYNNLYDRIELNNGQSVTLTANGIGFSYVINGTTSSNYDISVSGANIVDFVEQLPLATDAGNDTAITYMGLHNSSTGSDAQFDITITNNDAGVLYLRELHVLGDGDTPITGNDAVENVDPEIEYLPFGSFTKEEDRRSDASDGNQHTSRQSGAAVYFEYEDDNFGDNAGIQFARQTRAFGYGDVELCYGQIGSDTQYTARTNSQCQTIQNNQSNAYRVLEFVTPGADFCGTAGCWVSIRKVDGQNATFDYTRIYDTANPRLLSGFYEDTFPGIDYTGSVGTGDGNQAWSQVEDRRASGGFITTTTQTFDALRSGNEPVMSFAMNGTGYSVYFTMENRADAVQICHIADDGTRTAADALNGIDGVYSSCQVFDNESRRTSYTEARTVAGLPPGDYRVAVQMLTDNERPSAHSQRFLPLEMEIDAVEIHDDTWFTSTDTNWSNPSSEALNVLTPLDGRIETNYANRQADNNFIYYGDEWRTFDGGRGRRYSGSNYDRSRNEYGAGIIFRTANANALHFITDLRRSYSDARICATPVSAANPLTTNGETVCQDLSRDGRGFEEPLPFRFGGPASDNYVVSIMSSDNGIFNLDAVELFATDDTNGLTEGYYEATDVNIAYNSTYKQFVPNAQMETDAGWIIEGNGTGQRQAFTASYEGRYGWTVSGNNGDGIASDTFSLTEFDTLYTAIARVKVRSGTVQLKLVEDGEFNSIPIFSSVSSGETGRDWATLRTDFYIPSESAVNASAYNVNNLRLQVIATSDNTSFFIDDVSVSTGGIWQGDYSRRYSDDGNAWVSQTDGASMTFQFTGTGYEIGTIIGRQQGEMRVCYDDDPFFFNDSPESGSISQSCFTYQNEDRRPNFNTSRTVDGLPYGTYYVRVQDVENGYTVTSRANTTNERIARWDVGQIGIDYIRILNTATPPLLEPGYYDNTATDSNGDRYMTLVPQQDWDTIEGRFARRYTNESYFTPISDNGRAARRNAGETALLNVNVPPEGGGTVVVYTAPRTNRLYTSRLLICAGERIAGQVTYDGFFNYSLDSQGDNCVIRDTGNSTAVSVDDTELSALRTSGATDVLISSLSPGIFEIDAYQFIGGETLSAGIYDDFLPDSLLDFSTISNETVEREGRICDNSAQWCLDRNPRGYGGNSVTTRELDATLDFNIEGTGFSIITDVGFRGADMRICYQQTPLDGNAVFPSTGTPIDNSNVDLSRGDVWCDIVTTKTSEWNQKNPNRPNPRNGWQYGFAYYGLPVDEYSVEVRMIDDTLGFADELTVDAVAVFSDVNTATTMTPGFYDNTASEIRYEPAPFWEPNDRRFGPPRGPYNGTESTAGNAGSIAQMLVEGNSVTLYQTSFIRNSGDARVCVRVTDAVVHCTSEADTTVEGVQQDPATLPPYALAVELASFAQNDRRRNYFTPVMFYGLGLGEHAMIIENRDHNRDLSIDAIMVQP